MWGLGESGSALGSGYGTFNNTTSFDSEDNFTLTCAARNIQGPVDLPYSTTLLNTVRVCQSIFLIMLLSGGTLLNLLVIILVAKYKKLQTLSFGIALQIVAINLMLAPVTLIQLTNSIANRWVFGEHMCALVGSFQFLLTIVRVAVMLIFIIDRFLLVFCPYAYPKCQIKIIIILSVVPWLFAVVACIIGLVLDCYTYVPTTWFCSVNSSCNSSCSIFLGLCLVLYTAPSTIIPIFLYAILFIKARKVKKTMATAQGEDAETTNYDWKATITFFLLFISVFVLTLPNLAFFFITNAIYRGETLPAVLYVFRVIVVSFISLLPITDPIVIMRNKDVKEVISEIKGKVCLKFSSKTEQK